MRFCTSRVTLNRHVGQFRSPLGLIMGALFTLGLFVPALAMGDEMESPATIGPVTGDQTMWSIANENRPDSSVSIPQYMLAIVDLNPDAFIAGNVNLLMEGAILEMPSLEEALALPADEAQTRLDEQMAWFSDLSREERMALRDTADTDPPPSIEEPDAVVEPEDVAPEPDPVTEDDEDLLAAEDAPDPEPAPVEPEPAPEPREVVPEPEPEREAEVDIIDDVAEPDPVTDPVEERDPTEPEPEVLPDPPEEEIDPLFEPDPQLEPREETPSEEPVGDPFEEAPVEEAPAEEERTEEIAPPTTPGPEPATPIPWWLWAGAGLALLLIVLLILGIYNRRRQAAMAAYDPPDDDGSPDDDPPGGAPRNDDDPPRPPPSGPAAAAMTGAAIDTNEKPASESDETGSVQIDDPKRSDVDDDSPWASLEQSVMESDPDSDSDPDPDPGPDPEAATAVLEGSHPAEQADTVRDEHLEAPAPELDEDLQAPASLLPESDADQADDEAEDVFELSEPDDEPVGQAADEAGVDDQEFDWLELDESPSDEGDRRAHAESKDMPVGDSESGDASVSTDELSLVDAEEDFDLAEFSMASSEDIEAEKTEAPEGESEDSTDEAEFDLTNFDFDDTIVGEGEETVVQDDEPIDDGADATRSEEPVRGMDDLDELMAKDLKASGLIVDDQEDERTDIAPPLAEAPDMSAGESGDIDDSHEQVETTEEAPKLNDDEAEVMIDLARLTADGGDQQYARDLLAEVIRDGSAKMAEAARKLDASLG